MVKTELKSKVINLKYIYLKIKTKLELKSYQTINTKLCYTLDLGCTKSEA